ncbi:LOW QUALITY PROTEIN: hypothetical protein Cgig2_003117 [Carnegiea gigantea]|uniref:Uncharacterized protein n=1 Tax=Carnegiea gigantea TaxID=171969 RepID=A0A9Q1GYP3_9CARY|nr:LOW QUALITY PROTEIN: hypothetical protein Cgig2_003117 [Carnegiea gigantea]
MPSFSIESAAKWVAKLLVEEVEFLAKVRDKKGFKVSLSGSSLTWGMQTINSTRRLSFANEFSEIRDFAQKAEDVIGIYILNVSHKREMPRGLIPWTDLKWLLCCMRDAKTLHSVGSDIDTLIAKINELTGRSQRYEITRSNDELIDPYLVFKKRFTYQRRIYSHTENIVVGLDEYVQEVADQLVNGPQKLQLGHVCREILLQLIPRKDEEERKFVSELHDSQLPPKLYDVLKRIKRGILSTKRTVGEWRDVCGNLQSNLQGHVLYSGVYEVLALSYYELSYHLKARFLVLGYFPEDFEIPVERLYHLRIAEGIVSPRQDQEGGKRSLENIAKVYLNEVVHKGIVHVVSRDVMGDIKMCKLHVLMRDKCLQIAKGENFLLTSVCAKNHESLKLLRILDFAGFSSIGLSRSIRTLIYLRYLSLRGTRITELPSEIGNLRSLLILHLRLEGLRLPDVLWKRKSLKYLPSSGFSPDVKLRYVIEDSKALRVDKLSHLEIIEGLDLDTAEVKGLQELSTSLSLQRLKAKCSNKKENLDPFLKSSTIKSISLRIEVLEELPQLKKLSLFLCDDLPYWDVHISSNCFPELTHFVIKDNVGFMKWTIERGGLPELTHLVIKEYPGFVKSTVEKSRPPKLQELHLQGYTEITMTPDDQETNWVWKLLVEEVEFLVKVRDKMKSFSWDADHEQYKKAVIRQWISEIRVLAQEAEDVIELYILQVSHKRESCGLIPWTNLKWLLCCMRDAKTLHSVGSDIDTLIAKINELTGRSQRYGITRSNDELIDPYLALEKKFRDQRRTYSHIEDIVIGLNERAKEVADQLAEGP